MAIARLPELTEKEKVVPWAQNLVRDVTNWMALRPIVYTGEITLPVNPAVLATTLSNRFITPTSYIGLSPLNANAAGALGTGWYVPTRLGGSALITHQGSSLTRTYAYLIIT